MSFETVLICPSYVGLVRYRCEEQAVRLLTGFQDTLLYSFSEEVQFLALLTHHDQLGQGDFLSSNPFLRAALQEKFTVAMSSLAFSLLATFLDQHNLVLLAAIINEKLAVDILQDDVHRHLVDVNSLLTLPGYMQPAQRAWNTSKIILGVPGTGKALQNAQNISSLFSLVAPLDKNDAVVKAWLDKLVRPKATVRRAQAKKARTLEMPKKVSINAAMMISKERDQRPQGNALEPSVLFATIGNAADNLICMDINDSVTQAVTGYADSVVRVWRLDHGSNPHNPAFGQSLASCAYKWAINEVAPKPKQALTDEYMDTTKAALLQASEHALKSQEAMRYPCLELKGHSLPVYGVSQDSTQRLIVSCSADESIRLWDTAVLQCVAKYRGLGVAWDVRFHPLDYYFAAANQDRTVTVHSTDRSGPVRMFTGHTSDVNTVRWHGNGTLLASGGDDRTVRLWDIRKAECVRVLPGCGSAVCSLGMSPLGNLLAAGTDSGNIYLYELHTSRLLAILHGHSGAVHSLGFSSDGLSIASGGKDCSMRIWSTLPALEANPSAPLTLSTAEQAAKSQLVLKPRHSFFTKSAPVYCAGYTPQNMVFGGGPCQSATRDSMLWSAQRSAGAASEQEAAHLLGLSSAVPSNP